MVELVSISTWTDRTWCAGEKLHKEVRTLVSKEGVDTRKRSICLLRWDLGSH